MPDDKEILGTTEPLARISVLATYFIPSDPAKLPIQTPIGIAGRSGLFRFAGSSDASYSMVAELGEGNEMRTGCREDFFIPEDGLAWETPVTLSRPLEIQGIILDSAIAAPHPEIPPDFKIELWIGERGTFNYVKAGPDGLFKLKNVCFQRRHLRILRVVKSGDGDLISTPTAFDLPTCLPSDKSIVEPDTVRIPLFQPSGSMLVPLICG